MAAFSNYLESALLNATLRGTNFTAPAVADLHLALFTADPTDANATVNEVNASWYSRQPTGSWTAPADDSDGTKKSTNTAPITFPSVTNASITITHVGVYDAATAGNLLFHVPLQTQKTLDIGDVLSFAANNIVVKLD